MCRCGSQIVCCTYYIGLSSKGISCPMNISLVICIFMLTWQKLIFLSECDTIIIATPEKSKCLQRIFGNKFSLFFSHHWWGSDWSPVRHFVSDVHCLQNEEERRGVICTR